MSPAAADNPLTIPLSLLIIFVTAKALAEVFERLRLPAIVGEILAGVLVGPQVLHWLSPNAVLSAFSDLGLIFLLFRTGLEVNASELLESGATSIQVAVSGVILPFLAGWGIMRLWHAPMIEAVFVGVAMVATSVGITAEVLKRMGALTHPAGRIILGAAIFDDILGLLALSAATSLAKGGIHPGELTLTALAAIAFVVLVARWGSVLMKRINPTLNIPEQRFAIAMALLFALSALAVYAGVAAITGAFLAGLALSESADQRTHDLTSGVAELFLPFFLAGIGMKLDLATFQNQSNLVLAASITAAAILSKLIGCGLGAWKMGAANALRVGAGMIPRGEVGMIVAQIGVGFGVITQPVYGIIVAMSVVTTLFAPMVLRATFSERKASA